MTEPLKPTDRTLVDTVAVAEDAAEWLNSSFDRRSPLKVVTGKDRRTFYVTGLSQHALRSLGVTLATDDDELRLRVISTLRRLGRRVYGPLDRTPLPLIRAFMALHSN